MSPVIQLKYFFEKHGFHVSSRLADKLGMRASNVRIFFMNFCIIFNKSMDTIPILIE